MSVTVEKCLQAWTNSLRQMNAKADIVFFGDSLTYYGDFASVFPNMAVCNLGLRGDTIQGMIDRVEQVQVLQPKLVFLMAGINDVNNIPTDEFELLYNCLLEAIIQRLPKVTLIVQSILPVNSMDFCSLRCNNEQIYQVNQVIQKLAFNNRVKHIDLYELYIQNGFLNSDMTIDGIHLKPDSYTIWYDFLVSIVKCWKRNK